MDEIKLLFLQVQSAGVAFHQGLKKPCKLAVKTTVHGAVYNADELT